MPLDIGQIDIATLETLNQEYKLDQFISLHITGTVKMSYLGFSLSQQVDQVQEIKPIILT